jgi:hypothetical protein
MLRVSSKSMLRCGKHLESTRLMLSFMKLRALETHYSIVQYCTYAIG